MTQTLTTDELRQIVETDHVQCGDAAAMARELLANRETQPVMWVMSDDLKDEKIISTPAYPNRSDADDGAIGELTPLYTAPPAPAVPDAIPEVDRGEGGSDIDYMQPQEIYDMGKTDSWNACRAAMLAAAPEG
ncbi:MAG: hypothetical protein ACTIOQ_23600, partial [Serratia grimesii]